MTFTPQDLERGEEDLRCGWATKAKCTGNCVIAIVKICWVLSFIAILTIFSNHLKTAEALTDLCFFFSVGVQSFFLQLQTLYILSSQSYRKDLQRGPNYIKVQTLDKHNKKHSGGDSDELTGGRL
jgi:hypothetical protein